MAKKVNKAHIEKQKLKEQQDQNESDFSEKVESIFKILLRTMSWVVGIAAVAVLVLPIFNILILDKITTVLFRIGFSILIIFLFIELISNHIKKIISRLLNE